MKLKLSVELKQVLILGSCLGANLKVPLVEKHSLIVIQLVVYLHEHFNHKVVEST